MIDVDKENFFFKHAKISINFLISIGECKYLEILTQAELQLHDSLGY